MRSRPVQLAAVLAVPVFVALVLALFAWPSSRLAPRDLPVGAVGSLPQPPAGEGTFDLHRYASAASARHAIAEREVYGAVVRTGQGTTLLIASAASPLVAQLLEQAWAPPAGSGPRVRIVDVVPADPQDPHGSAFAASLLPLVLAGIAIGIGLGLGLAPGAAKAAALVVAAALAGLAGAGVVQGWLGVLEGSWPRNAAVLALTALAIGATVAGLGELLGLAGFLLGAGLMMIVGNPFSAVASAPELLPRPVGTIGQLLPPGAGGNALRSTAFFDGAGAARHVEVLAVWAVLGLAALLAGARLGAQRRAVPARVLP